MAAPIKYNLVQQFISFKRLDSITACSQQRGFVGMIIKSSFGRSRSMSSLWTYHSLSPEE